MDKDYQYVGTELEIFRLATNWKNYLRAQIQPLIRGHVLEVGAGIGGTTQTLFTPAAKSWTCLEPDSQLATKLQQVAGRLSAEHDFDLRLVIGTTVDLQDSRNRFDTILYIDVLEHIEDDRGETQMARRLLNSGGRLIILSPAHQWLFSPFDEAIGHFRRYNRKMIAKTVPEGMTKVRLRYLDSVGLLASLGNRFLLRSKMPTQKQIGTWDKAMVPLSRVFDPCSAYLVGKSILGVWENPGPDEGSKS